MAIEIRQTRRLSDQPPLLERRGHPGPTILLHAEQGFGDNLQFIRFAPLVKKARRPCVWSSVRHRCSNWSPAVTGSTWHSTDGSYEPNCHVHAPLLSLPAIFGTTLDTLPAQVPYLVTDKVLVDHWRAELARATHRERRWPLARGWLGSGAPCEAVPDRHRLAGKPRAQQRSVAIISTGQFRTAGRAAGRPADQPADRDGLDQLRAADRRFPIIELPGRRCRDFMETAAIMTHLDLVITPDTALAHLAGGLGLRVWTGLCTVDEWRWLAGRDDTPWYPTMRLFRQTTLGDWDGVFRRMTDALKGGASMTGNARHGPKTQPENVSLDLATWYRDQAIVLSLEGRFAESEACSREALRIRPDDVDVLNELGVAVWRQGRPTEAEEIYLQACQIKPDDFRILTNLGLALYNQGRIDEAGDCYRRAIQIQARRLRRPDEPGDRPLRPGQV